MNNLYRNEFMPNVCLG